MNQTESSAADASMNTDFSVLLQLIFSHQRRLNV